jgi:hypothetical protein
MAGFAVAAGFMFMAGYFTGRQRPHAVDRAAAEPVPQALVKPPAMVVPRILREAGDAATARPDGMTSDTGSVAGEPDLAALRRQWERARMMPLGPERNRQMTEALADLAELDPKFALAEAGTIEEVRLRREAQERVIRTMGESNPELAWELLSNAPNDGSLPRDRIELMLDGIASGDAQRALDFLWNHRDELGPYRNDAQAALDEIYQNGGHDELKSWVEAMPEGKWRDAATNRFIDQWARYDPAAAKAWMESQNIPASNLPAARVELAESWARVRPHEAIEWVRGLPENAQSRELYDAVFRQWISYDRNVAADWLANQPPSPMLDRPIERYTWQVMEIDPQNSMPWAESITDEGRRFRMMSEIAERWGRRDPLGLANFVASRDLPAQQKQRLLRSVQPRRQ